MPKVTILDKREIPSSDPQRVGRMDALITYQVDTFRTYLVTLPNEDLGGADEDKIVADAIRIDMSERERWSKKELEI